MSISLRDRIRKRREEEDDDMMLFVFPALYLMGSSGGGKKKKRHTSEETSEIKARRLLERHIENCRTTFRMEPHIFQTVATCLGALRELYDGKYSFLYLESQQEEEPLLQNYGENDDQGLDDIVVHDIESEGEDIEVHRHEGDGASHGTSDRSVEVLQRRAGTLPQDQRRSTFESGKKEQERKRPRKSANIEGMMERYLEMRIKQAEAESSYLAREKETSQGSEFLIKRCIAVLSTMQVTREEMVKAYGIFKNAENREIFLSSFEQD